MNTKPVIAIATLAVVAFAGNTAMAQQVTGVAAAAAVTESPDQNPAQYAQYVRRPAGNALTRAEVKAPVLAAHAAGVTQFASESPDVLPLQTAQRSVPGNLSRAEVKAPVLAAHASGVTRFASESADSLPAGRNATAWRATRSQPRS